MTSLPKKLKIECRQFISLCKPSLRWPNTVFARVFANAIKHVYMQGFQKTNMPSSERLFYLLNTRNICVIFLYNWKQCIDSFNLSTTSMTTGLKINSEKTKLLRINTTSNENVQIDEHDIEDVESFVYLGAYISKSGGTEEDIKARLGKARAAYSKLDKIWKNSKFTYKTKIKMFKSNVLSVLLYGCECWRMTKTDEQKLDAFLHKSLRRLFKIYWPMRVTN